VGSVASGVTGRSPGRPAVAAALALALSAVAVWLTLRADFLAHSEWLALQKADFILGPVLTGLYWMRRRPQSRFGPMLVAFGFLSAGYLLHSSSEPWLFSIGLMWENVIGLATYVLILAFPTGRLDGLVPKAILAFATVAAILPAALTLLLLPQIGAGGSISACRAACPPNEMAITSDPALAMDLFTWFRYAVVAVALATAALLLWRLVTGTPPQRRALAIGTPVALLFLAFQIAFQVLGIAGVTSGWIHGAVAWAFVAARAALWYGFLFALIGAELFAGRALREMVLGALRRPARDELAALLRTPLGDPRLELRFAGGEAGAAAAADAPAPAGRDVTTVAHAGAPSVTIVHDRQLDDHPELLRAAGAVALLAAQNAHLDAAWAEGVQALRRSRRRLVRVADDERHRVERDLHDGVQQQLVSLRIRLDLLAERPELTDATRRELGRLGDQVEEALDEVREIAHGLYPPVLRELGLAGALAHVHGHAPTPVTVRAERIGRYDSDVESAVYYCCREAVQNAIKHGGPAVRVCVALREDAGELRLEVADDGQGFVAGPAMGAGLQNMEDRLGALGGCLRVSSEAGGGTTVAGAVPVAPRPAGARPVRDGAAAER